MSLLRLSLMTAAGSLLMLGYAGGTKGASSGWFQVSPASRHASSANTRRPSAAIAGLRSLPGASLERSERYGHLYVSSATSQAVYRFPLVKGLPSQPPDATITGFSYPLGIATDTSGALFVADDGAHVIKVFANDQRGQPRLVRSLSTTFVPELIAVTGNGYMVVTGNNTELDVYRVTAKGNEKPLATVIPSTNGVIYALASDASNTIYISVLFSVGIEAFPNLAPPPGHGTLHLSPTHTIQAIPPDDFWYGLTLHDGRIFARLNSPNKPAPGVQYAVYPSSGNGRLPPLRVIAATACRPPYHGIAYGVLISDDLLYQACDSPRAGVFVYNSRAKRAVPIASVTGPFVSADYLALAP